jgi:hypothetical protein
LICERSGPKPELPTAIQNLADVQETLREQPHIQSLPMTRVAIIGGGIGAATDRCSDGGVRAGADGAGGARA